MPRPFAGWKYALIAGVLLLGLLFALPNWFGKSPAVQMQFATDAITENQIQDVNRKLQDAGLASSRWTMSGNRADFYFDSTDAQLQAKDILATAYPDAAVAVNLLSNAPS